MAGKWTLAAYSQSVDLGDVLTAINAVADQHITVSGTFIRVPTDLNKLMGYGVLMSSGGTQRAQIAAPSLRGLALMDFEPAVNALVWGSPPEMTVKPRNPVQLVPTEGLEVYLRNDPAAAERQYALVLLSDGPVDPVEGPIFSVRGTTAISLSAGLWVNGAITFTQTLPAGKYRIVGMRALGTNLVAARLVFVGGLYRPGVPAINAVGDLDNPFFRNGVLGDWGDFDALTPPTIDALGVTDTTQTYIFDIQKIA